jgi:hypothetical protein
MNATKSRCDCFVRQPCGYCNIGRTCPQYDKLKGCLSLGLCKHKIEIDPKSLSSDIRIMLYNPMALIYGKYECKNGGLCPVCDGTGLV